MQLDQSRDWLVWDNTEPVTYQSTRHGNLLDVIPTVLRGELSAYELAQSGGVYVAEDVTFLIPAALLAPGFVPKPADIITDANQTAYTILRVFGQQRDANGFQIWKAICRDPIIAYDLQDLVTIERAAITYGPDGAVVKTFPPAGGQALYTNLAARVQEQSVDIIDQRLIHGPQTSHTVYVSRQIDVDPAEDRIKWVERGTTAVRYLDIVKVYKTNQLGELPAIAAELRP